MTIWILQSDMSPAEETRIFERTHLRLPFEGLPDLTRVSSQAHAMQMLRLLHPDAPPESLTRHLDRFWEIFTGVHAEDMIAVPLASSDNVVLATVTGKYEHALDENKNDLHLIPVKWHEERIPVARFGKHKTIFKEGGRPMYEVTAQETRIVIRDKLPHKYNRFAKWKWLLVIFMMMGFMQLALPMLRH